ncbi:DUF6126 family protein [Actinacidiphila alni]|uniref:DUF6126 family protein n=1 Tax=Actinacidiphila alni TaxID=380248 RepID=UPI003454385F
MSDTHGATPAPDTGSGTDTGTGTPGYDGPVDRGAGTEKYKERGVVLRVLVYVIAGHLFAGFLWLLFYVGTRSHG